MQKRRRLLLLAGGSADAPPANSAPVISASNLTINEDGQGDVTVSYFDADDDAANWTTLTATVLSGNIAAAVNTPANGQIRVTTTQANWSGSGSIEVAVEDALGNVSNTLTIAVTVSSVNDAPVLQAGSLTINEDSSGVITLTATDIDGTINWASLRLVSAPAHGTVQLNTPANGQVTYSGAANNHTDVTFTLAVSDNSGAESAPSTMTITINSVADAPALASPIAINTNEDTAVILDVDEGVYSHPDGTARRTTSGSIITSTPSHGTLTVNQATGAITYTPNVNWSGSDSFTVQVYDANDVLSNVATVNVTVAAVDDASLAYNTMLATFMNNSVVINNALLKSLVQDVEGHVPDWSTLEVVTSPAHGVATANTVNGTITYAPATNNKTTVTFTWRVQANGTWTNPATVRVLINDTATMQAIKNYDPYTYYPLNELSGTFADASGNGRTAASVVNNSGFVYDATRTLDNTPAPRITGATQYIDVGVDANTKGVINTRQWTLVVYFRRGTFNYNDGTNRLITQFFESTTTNNQVFIQTLGATGNLKFSVKTGNVTKEYTTSALANNDNWHVAAIVFDDLTTDTIRCFLDGVMVQQLTTISTPNVAGSTSFRLGNSSGSWLDGIAAHWALYNTALPDSSVINLSAPKTAEWKTLSQQFAEKGVLAGIALPLNYDSRPAEQKAIVESGYGAFSHENGSKRNHILNNGWSSFNQVVTLAKNLNAPWGIHPFTWHQDDLDINGVARTRTAAIAEIRRHAQAFRDQITSLGASDPLFIDVVNEAILDDTGAYRYDDFVNAFGNGTSTDAAAYDRIKTTFEILHEYFPKTILVYADYNCEKRDTKSLAVYDLCVNLINDGAPIDGVHFQAHWKHGEIKWLYDADVLTQVNAFKALKSGTFKVGYSELDTRMSRYQDANVVVANTSAGTTLNVIGSTGDPDGLLFDPTQVGWQIINLVTGATRTIATYTDNNTVVVDSAIDSSWHGQGIKLYFAPETTVAAGTTGTTLVAAASVFRSNQTKYCVWNKTRDEGAVILTYTSGTQVTLDRSVSWSLGDAIEIGINAHWFMLMKETGAKLYYAGFWNVFDGKSADGMQGNGSSWLGPSSQPTLYDHNYERKAAYYAVLRGMAAAT